MRTFILRFLIDNLAQADTTQESAEVDHARQTTERNKLPWRGTKPKTTSDDSRKSKSAYKDSSMREVAHNADVLRRQILLPVIPRARPTYDWKAYEL